jgi:hypothetical protein
MTQEQDFDPAIVDQIESDLKAILLKHWEVADPAEIIVPAMGFCASAIANIRWSTAANSQPKTR